MSDGKNIPWNLYNRLASDDEAGVKQFYLDHMAHIDNHGDSPEAGADRFWCYHLEDVANDV